MIISTDFKAINKLEYHSKTKACNNKKIKSTFSQVCLPHYSGPGVRFPSTISFSARTYNFDFIPILRCQFTHKNNQACTFFVLTTEALFESMP